MSGLIKAFSPHKRKREPDEDMPDHTPRKRSIRDILFPWASPGFLRRSRERAGAEAKVRDTPGGARKAYEKPQKNALRSQQHNHDIPGSFPDSAGLPSEHKDDEFKMSSKAQHRSSTNLQRPAGDRNTKSYWTSLGHEISTSKSVASHLDPALHDLPQPSPFLKPRRKVPSKSRPLHSGHKSLGTSRIHGATQTTTNRHLKDAQSTLRISTDGIVTSDDQEIDDSQDQIDEFFKNNSDLEGLANVSANLRRSEKLSAKDRNRRGVPPVLNARLREVVTHYYHEEAEEEARKLRPKTPEKPRQLVVPLATDVLNSLPNLAKLEGSQQLGIFGRTPVTARDMLTLRNGVWLNDEVINSWLWELCDKAKAALAKEMEARGMPIKDDTPRYHAFNTQWYPTMKAPDWRNKVPRWAKRAKIDGANLLKVHKVLIPIHHGSHWTLLVILPQRRTVRYYDSLAGNAKPYLQAATDWVSHELGDKWIESEWRIEQADSGQQVNMSDCGVFLSLNALATFYTDVLPEVLPTGELSNGRELMKYILLNGGFKDDYDLAKLHPSFRLEEDRQVNGEVRKANRDNVKAG